MDKSHWLEHFAGRHNKALVRYATAILKDREAAKKVVQECFLSLLQNTIPRDNVQAWLFKQCRKRLQALGGGHELPAPDNPLHDLEHQGDAARLQTEIQKLPPRQQEALWLKYKDGLSYKEIAEVMEISPSNVGFILYEAINRLREGPAK